ncbi:MAG: hypothetical protein IJX47_01165 [Clostridia bacterium]|nr:hypothetical protein [Clostridia bacterium]
MNKRNFKAFLAVLLTVVMVFSIVPMSVSAEEATYTKIDSVADLTAGTYKMSGYRESYQTNDWSANPYHVWNGTVNGGDLVTTCYSYNDSKLAVAAGSTDDAANVQLVAVEGKTNTYYITTGGKYLYSTQLNNRKLALGDDPTEWVATDNANGGITMTTAVADGTVSLGTNDAASKLLRSYKAESTLKYGVVFFAAASESGSEGGETTEGTEATISFATTEALTTPDSDGNKTQQIWQQNGVTVTYDKANYSDDLAVYSAPIRFYAGTNVTIAYPGMTTVVINCNSGKSGGPAALKASIKTEGATVAIDGMTVTITFASAVDAVVFEEITAQTRVDSITVYTGSAVPDNGSDGDETPVLPTTPEEIVNAAYALESGASLDGTYTLTGVITTVNTAYNETYKNVTVTIQVGDMTDKLIQCYRMKGEGADTIKTGDTITVTGTLKNFNGTVEFDAGCTLDNVVPGKEEVVIYETAEEIVNAAYELEVGASLSDSHNYTLTGVITSVDTEYSEQYKNVTVTIVVDGMTDKPIVAFRLKGDGADVIKVGDTITVTGAIVNWDNKDGTSTVEFNSGCTLDSYTAAPESTPDPVPTGDGIIVLISVVLIAGAALVVVSRKRRFN